MAVTLGRDLLWHIFSMNAGMELPDIPAINTLRLTSQVCSAWRDLAIASPSLWGRVIDFDWLRHNEWRAEVIRRAGNSDLFVQGGTDHRGLHGIQHIVISILTENWPRIRSLKIEFQRSQAQDFENDLDLWSLLERPAGVLESFQLSLETTDHLDEDHDEDHGPPILSPAEFKVFDSHAPFLKVFATPNLKFDIRAPWTSHIRHLTLTTPIPLHELFDSLCNMSLLETLEDQSCSAITLGDADRMLSRSKVALPQLQDIRIYTPLDINPSMTFLDQIVPVYGRLLAFSSRPCGPDYDPNAEAIGAASEILSTFSKHAEFGGSIELDLRLMRYLFAFAAILPDKRSFRFDQCCYADFPVNTAYKLFTALNFADFCHVKKLTLWLQEIEGVLLSDRKIAQFITSLTSIEILDTTPETLQFLLHIPNAFLEDAFPTLQDIFLRYPRGHFVDLILPFLTSRRAIRRPISTLSIVILLGQHDLTALDEVTGLNVIILFYRDGDDHKLKEYTCGSGKPEELRIGRERC